MYLAVLPVIKMYHAMALYPGSHLARAKMAVVRLQSIYQGQCLCFFN